MVPVTARGRRGGQPVWSAVVLLVVLTLGLAACTDDGDPEATTSTDPAPPAAASTEVPDVPVPTEPDRPAAGATAGDTEVDGTVGTIEPGDVVLLHLEGPLGDREATDVVIRDPAGAELERYRLPGAVSTWAAPGASHALIRLLPSGWARYDAADGTLSLLAFPGEPPEATIRPGEGLGRSVGLFSPTLLEWAVPLGGGEPVRLSGAAEGTTVIQQSADGTLALLDLGGDIGLLRTTSGEVETLPGPATMSDDGEQVVWTQPVDEGREVVVQGAEGNRQVLGVTDLGGTPIPLPDGRVLLTGAAPSIMGLDGEVAPLDPAVPLSPPARVSTGGTHVLAGSGDGLALVDVGAASAVALEGTVGFLPLSWGPAQRLWALSADAAAPGGVVVDPSTGSVTPFLADTPTERITAVSGAAERVAVAVPGPEGRTTVLVDADGTVTPVLGDRTEVALHPDGLTAALAATIGNDRRLVIGPLAGDVVEVDTGRSPVWLRTTGPLGRQG